MKSIPQLRVRTEFSFRRVYGPVPKVVARLDEVSPDAPAGIVDAGGTWGHVRWGKALPEGRAMYGVEVPIPTDEVEGARPAAWVLAAGENTRGFYRFSSAILQPDADPRALLAAHSSDLVRFSGMGLVEGADDGGLIDYVDLNPVSRMLQADAFALAKRLGKPLVITSRGDYPSPRDSEAFLAMGGRSGVGIQWLCGEAEMRASLPPMSNAEWSKIVAATHEAAERTARTLAHAKLVNVDGDLWELAARGKAERLASGRLKDWTEVHETRLAREREEIEAKGFESYFLVVADLIRWAKGRMLVGPGRGSSSGSLLCFLIGITEVNPLDHGLLFERFIDINRSDLPDIDIDFDDEKREQVFQYLADKYGAANVARIGSINNLKPRSAMAEACNRLGIPHDARQKVLDALIQHSSGDSRYGKGLEDTFTGTDPGRAFLEKYPEAKVVTEIENHAWHSGVHAAGVLVSNEPISDFCTINGEGIAQINKHDAEALNLLKIDALGLRTLGVLSDAGIEAETLYNLTLDDPKVFQVINDQRFCNIFQFEGAAQRNVCAQVHVDSFKTLDHITALARPGPLGGGAAAHYVERKAGREEVEPAHQLVEDVVKDSYGVIIYQEQVMNVVKTIGNFSWKDVSIIRKAMSASKGREFFDQKGRQFVEGAATHGIDAPTAQHLWDSICTFGAWSMNRAHTAAYATISYWCAWAKCYHPLEFAAASLRRAKGDQQVFDILRELDGEGVEYKSFDPELSQEDWSVQDGKIVGGFRSLHGVGPAKARALVEKREREGWLDAEAYSKYKDKFANLYPLRSKYAALIADPFAFGCRSGSVISECNSLPRTGFEEILLVGTVVKKRLRDKNESLMIAKRGGLIATGKTAYFDMRIRDDGPVDILCRFGVNMFEVEGRYFFNNTVENKTEVLVRGRTIPNLMMVNVIRAKILNPPDPDGSDDDDDDAGESDE